MSNSLRFGSAVSAIALASALAGCATPQAGARSASIFGGSVDTSNIGVATRAMVALSKNDFATAVKLAERAVENSPRDGGFRALLGNSYFASGRFGSAESAYRDSLALVPNQPQVVVKLALVQIAQGRNAEAIATLNAARSAVDASDFGLALALAGEPGEAVRVLEWAARDTRADARLRQNLALAHALSGDWTEARTVAAQDLSEDLVDARIQQWMQFAKPATAASQVAALTGVSPVAGDPGQPARLALRDAPTRTADAAPAAEQPVAAYVPPPEPVAEVAPVPQFAEVSPVSVSPPVVQEPAAAATPAPEPRPFAAAPEASSAFAAMAAFKATAKPAKQAKAAPKASFRRASLQRATGNSTVVLQLGAYGSPQRVAAAWNNASRRFESLRAYSPMSARFNSSKGLVHRLSVRGFDNADQAKDLCLALRRAGGSCFVRTVAGDQPVRLASR